ncbi:MAG: hypothetical protein KC656_16905 [Myxococcales bacterium]|nr:hypothetical protein [Myxococcales bacterium]MCB9670553.1 hypothetical protein [Alphaproteobacteria bacterium]MCB9691954.1 hypothetical protein [Alphaproteobacteria bacterium]
MIEVLVRGRFVPLDDASARRIAGNTWEIRIPDPASIARRTRRGASPEDWDGAVFVVDGAETEPGVGSGGGPDHVVVTAWIV